MNISQVSSTESGEASPLVALGNAALARGRTAEAIAILEQALSHELTLDTARSLSKAYDSQARDLLPGAKTHGPRAVERHIRALIQADSALDTVHSIDRGEDLERSRRRIRKAIAGALFTLGETGASDRRGAIRSLDRLFNEGRLPSRQLEGRHEGVFVATTLSPGADRWLSAWTALRMPWHGKVFYPGTHSGENVFDTSVIPVMRPFMPQYQGFKPGSDGQMLAFTFKTWTGHGVVDQGLEVLKIDYDIPETPRSLRRVLDEIVELVDGAYLGKANLRSLTGEWVTAAYFALFAGSSD